MARAGTAKTQLIDGQRVPIAPITSESLTDQPNFNLTQPPPATEMDGLGGAIEVQTTNFLKDLETKKLDAEKSKDQSFDMLMQSLADSEGEVALTDKAYEKTVDPLETELKDINQQILEEQHALRRRQEAIQKNSEGGLVSGMQNELRRVTNESIAKQADLSVIQLARQGRYDSAKAIADRNVAAKLEQQRQRNEMLRFNYDENKELFTVAEQRAFETAQRDRERALDAEEATLKQISDLSLQALVDGAPASVATAMRQAKTVEEAMSIGGQYVGALDRQAKLASINASNISARKSILELAAAGDVDAITKLGFDPRSSTPELSETEIKDTRERVRAGTNLSMLISEYKTLLDQKGFENYFWGNKEVLGKYNTLRGQIVAEYKDAKKLGTLDAGLLKLADQIVGELPEANSATANIFNIKSNKISSQLDTFLTETNRQLASDKMLLGDYSGILDDVDIEEVNSIYTDFNPEEYFRK